MPGPQPVDSAKVSLQEASRTTPLLRSSSGEVPDRIFTYLMTACGLAVLGMLVLIVYELIQGSGRSWHAFGFKFFADSNWDPVNEQFGALPFVFGTLISSLVALIIAVPLAVGTAVFTTEMCPRALRNPLSFFVELLAAIPSVIYGLWAIFVLVPLMRSYVQPFLGKTLGWTGLFTGPPYGIGMLTGSLILAVMVLPFVASISRDVFETVPPMLKESAYGMGCTTWEVVGNVVIPYTRIGVIGGMMLALGRALGETMAVTFVIGNAHKISASLIAPGTTISATIANEFTEAVGDLYTSSLIAIGLILFMITFVVLALARLMLMRLDVKAGK